MGNKRNKSLLTGLAGAAVLAGGSQAYGTIVVVNVPANIIGNDPAATTDATPTRRFVDLDGNGTDDIQLAYRSFNASGPGGTYYIQQSFVSSLSGQTAAYGPVGSQDQFYAYELGAGDAIPGANNFGQHPTNLTHIVTYVNGNTYGLWQMGDRGFVGFRFTDLNGQVDYGYIELETDAFADAKNPGGLQFFRIAYEDSGKPIAAGAVPEPSSLAALAFGGAGLAAAALRRRKKS
jgi:PEP-CTERM motif-containing protein